MSEQKCTEFESALRKAWFYSGEKRVRLLGAVEQIIEEHPKLAAAPELYEIVEHIAIFGEDMDIEKKLCDQAKKVIAKIEAKQ